MLERNVYSYVTCLSDEYVQIGCNLAFFLLVALVIK